MKKILMSLGGLFAMLLIGACQLDELNSEAKIFVNDAMPKILASPEPAVFYSYADKATLDKAGFYRR
jgi:hypothetical protein